MYTSLFYDFDAGSFAWQNTITAQKVDDDFSWSYLCNEHLPTQERVTETTKIVSFDS